MNPFVTNPPDKCVDNRWPVLNGKPMVFIGSVAVRAEHGATAFDLPDVDLYVFGGRIPILGTGSYRIEFTVLEHGLADSSWKEHQLSQHDSMEAFCKKTDFDKCLDAEMMAKSDFRFIRRKPRMKMTDALWPAINKKPMVFLTQWPLHKAELSKNSTMVFLFADQEDGGALNVKIWNRLVGLQTAEDHYQAEELIALFEANRNDEEVVARCILDGDEYVHEFILEHPDVSAKALELLAKQGQGKKLREAAAGKLRQRK